MFGDSTGLSGVGSRLVAFGVGEGPNILRPARNTDKQRQILDRRARATRGMAARRARLSHTLILRRTVTPPKDPLGLRLTPKGIVNLSQPNWPM